MLGAVRKFSSSFYGKFFLCIVAIPFIFWGMGPVFQGGKQNTIVEIGKNKIPTQEFINYIENRHSSLKEIDKNIIDKMLYSFIGEKLISFEIKSFDIKLSENSLSKIIKNQKIFKKDNKFYRTEYEKFLIKNQLSAILFETNLSNQNKKEQLFDFIGSGIMPSNFLVNIAYNKINQKRNIALINLNEIFKQKITFSEDQIKSHFNESKNSYQDTYKSIKFVTLNPKKLTGNDEFNDLFFKKIDEIDDFIIEGKKLNFLLRKFNLELPASLTFNKMGKNKKLKSIENFPNELINDIFKIDMAEPIILVEHVDKYFIVELTKTETIQKNLEDHSVKEEIIFNLTKQMKRKLVTEIINKINKNEFKKTDFDKLANDKKVIIQKIKLENRNDDQLLKKELTEQIYSIPYKEIMVISDIGLTETFLVFIDNIENIAIDKNAENYNKYLNLSKIEITNGLFNAYDTFLRSKYKIKINYKSLDKVKNYIE